MRLVFLASALGIAALAAFFLGVSLAPAPSTLAGSLDDAAGTESPAPRPVLVELFTSQGCSSCPPADTLLQVLADDPHRRIIPLSFHVDYWNRLGWRDPFSSAEWSERQRKYNEAMRTGRVYTPQLVIDGQSHCVGSDVKEVYRRIDEATRRPLGVAVKVDARPVAGGLEVRFRAEVHAKEGVSVESMAETGLFLALAETGLETSVKSGENARRSLKNDFVVRRLQRIGALDVNQMSFETTIILPLDGVKVTQNVRLVGFAQESPGGRVHGAASWEP